MGSQEPMEPVPTEPLQWRGYSQFYMIIIIEQGLTCIFKAADLLASWHHCNQGLLGRSRFTLTTLTLRALLWPFSALASVLGGQRAGEEIRFFY